MPADIVLLAADHAAAEDHEDHGELILIFNPGLDPALLEAFAPEAAFAIRSQCTDAAGGVPKADTASTAAEVGPAGKGSALPIPVEGAEVWTRGLLAGIVAEESAACIGTSWTSSLLAAPGLPAPGTDLSRLDRRVLRALRAEAFPADLLITVCCSAELPMSRALAWRVLRADLAVAWTALEDAAWAAGMPLVRRSARIEQGLEVCQLALRGVGVGVVGPVGVGDCARSALHRAALGLMELLADPDPRTKVRDWGCWAGVRGLVERAGTAVVAASVEAAPDSKGRARCTGRRSPAVSAKAEVRQARDEIEDLDAKAAHHDRRLAGIEKVKTLMERMVERHTELQETGSEEEKAAAARQMEEHLRYFRMDQDAQWNRLREVVPSDGSTGDMDGAVHRVGVVDGQPLWAGRIRLTREGEERVLLGPVQPSETAALEAAAVLALREMRDTQAPEPSDLLQVWNLLAPQLSWPCVAEFAETSKMLSGFGKTVEGNDSGPVTVTMSARAAGSPVSARAVGESEEAATERCARGLLAVLSGERGFGPLDWTAEVAEQRLTRFFGEPWLSGRKLRTGKAPGAGRRAELSCRVGGQDVRVAAIAEYKEFAELAAQWLLVQEIAARVPAGVLECEPGHAKGALTALHGQDVLGQVEFADGPGGGEAVLAHVELGDGRVWATGPDHDQACAGLLEAVRCRVLSPAAAEESNAGAPPHWIAQPTPRPSQDRGGVTAGEELLEAVRGGARLCPVGLDGGPVGFVTVDGTTRKAKSGGRARDGWRVWSERGALAAPGPAVAVGVAAQYLLAAAPDDGWDASAVAWRRVLRFGCQVVAAGQIAPGVRADGRAVWRPGPLGDEQNALLSRLTDAMPPWAHSAALPGRREEMWTARTAADLVLVELADTLVRGPGVAAVWGHNPLTAPTTQPAGGAVAAWLDAVEEIADAVPPPGVVLQVMPPPRPQAPAASLQVNIRLRPTGPSRALVTLPDLRTRLGTEHPAVLRAQRALRKAAELWPALRDAADGDRVRVSPGQAALLLGHLGRALRRAGIEVVWPEQWASRLRATVVASGPPSGGLSLDQLVDYRWQVRVDGSVLSPRELEHIAQSAGTLVWLRSRWLLVDEALAERARGRSIRRNVPAGEALSAVLLGSIQVEDGEHADLVADGSLADLAALLTGASHTPVAPPKDLAGTLWPHQTTGLSWLANVTTHFGALLCDEMGLGKTIQTIALMLHRAQTGSSRGLPVLVVTPASMVLTWARQVKEFAPTLPVRIYHGTERTLEGLAADEVVVTSYGTLVEDRTALSGQTFSLLVADEAQAVKNAASQRSQALAEVPALTRLGLTGTPIENRILDLGNLLHWSNPALFSPQAFQRTFGSLDHGPDPQTQSALNRVAGTVMLRRRKNDPHVALDLPDKIDSTHVLALTQAQTGLYTRTARIAMEAVRTAPAPQRSGAVLRLITQLRQVCNSPQHLRIGSVDSGRLDAALAGYDPTRASREASKFAALDDLVPSIIDDGPGSAVIFTEYRVMAMLLHRHAAAWGCRPLLHVGSMTMSERDAALTAFRQRRSRLLIVTYGSGGTGLDLTTASHAILADSPFNPARINQAVDRLHRPGQHKPVHIHRLQTAGTIEDKISRMLARKSGLLDALSPHNAFDPALLSDHDLHELIALGTAA
ncbi:SNF2-related protein [Streptomyces sp. NPDC001478]